MTDGIIVLEPGEERAQKIAKAMGSQTASDILRLLAGGAKSLTDITDTLAVPMNTAKYHVGNLLDAGLITVTDTKYSVKGREVKLYSLTNQLLIVAPRQADLRSLLLKYAALFGIVAVASLAVSVILPLIASWSAASPPMAVPAAFAVGGAERSNEVGTMAMKVSSDTWAMSSAAGPDPALAFFLGGILVIFVLLCYEAWLWKKR
ncbi:ArsR/SmtB family transcription factor [Methanoregula sp.]|jgi:predicted ArsR family transcriptional regulator|uniref:ArsR/SmtB family transcription factor n=1 Tax=Methanoregula sp. TaxID=2052170 RepID=UPI003C1BD2BC